MTTMTAIAMMLSSMNPTPPGCGDHRAGGANGTGVFRRSPRAAVPTLEPFRHRFEAFRNLARWHGGRRTALGACFVQFVGQQQRGVEQAARLPLIGEARHFGHLAVD